MHGGLKVGDRVEIRAVIHHLKHRKNRNGVITNVDGALIMVKPMWCYWEVELYPGELRKL